MRVRSPRHPCLSLGTPPLLRHISGLAVSACRRRRCRRRSVRLSSTRPSVGYSGGFGLALPWGETLRPPARGNGTGRRLERKTFNFHHYCHHHHYLLFIISITTTIRIIRSSIVTVISMVSMIIIIAINVSMI